MREEGEPTPVEPQDPTLAAEEEDDEASSPFDHPAFLPVLLVAMAAWFGYDGWFSTTIESVNFNRYGFIFLLGAALYFLAADFTRLPFLLPALFLAYGVWLGLFHLLGAPDAWWKDEGDGVLSAANFNLYGSLACFAIAAVALVRDLVRKRPQGARSEP